MTEEAQSAALLSPCAKNVSILRAMPSLLPLPPGLARSLPWRMNFRTQRQPATLDAFADPSFVKSLSPDELEHCETVVATLLKKMLDTGKLPPRVSRLRVTQAVSQRVFDALGLGAAGATLSNLRYTVREARFLIDTAAKLVHAIDTEHHAPSPGSPVPGFSEAEYEDIGHHGASPAAVGGPKERKARVAGPKVVIDLEPLKGAAARRKREDPALRMLAPSGGEVRGNDFRFGHLMGEAHRVVPLDQRPLQSAEVIERLRSSRVSGAQELAGMLSELFVQTERAIVADEIRDIVRRFLRDARDTGGWDEVSLRQAFGVGIVARPGQSSFDPGFWSGARRREAGRIRALNAMTEVLATRSLYSPALRALRNELSRVEFMSASRLQSYLGPLLGGANVVGVCRFVTEVLSERIGVLAHAPVSNFDGQTSDLYFWANRRFDTSAIFKVCVRARDLTLAQGAFACSELLEAAAGCGLEVSDQRCVEILQEWSAVSWLSVEGWGIVQGHGRLLDLVEQMLHVTYPKPLLVEDAREALEWSIRDNAEVHAARERTGALGFVPSAVLLEALHGQGKIERAGPTSWKLTEADAEYWDWHPYEREVIAYLRSVGGSALVRDICRQFNGDKGFERTMFTATLRIWPFCYAPVPARSALRPWAL